MADEVDFKVMTSADLRSWQKEIEKELSNRSEADKRTLWEEFKAKAAELGTSAEDLLQWASSSAKTRSSKNPAPIKYRGPNGETWTERGRMPKWLETLVKAGHHRSDFLIDKSARAHPTETQQASLPEQSEEQRSDAEPAEQTEAGAEAVEKPRRKQAGKRKPEV